ncbi:glycosyltransferase [Kouleothrix sp.]|uniref:glycosyltransferase n=1 Tax=Kouleothrix sp. TaxID=2779161 RepID=UPI00391CAB88
MRIAMLSIHSSPIAALGGKEAGGMNVYVRELSRELGRRGIAVDMFTRSQDPSAPTVVDLGRNVRVINLHTGPSAPYDKNWVLTYLPEFVSRARCFADGEDLTYDLIHSHYWLSGEAALALRRSWGVPVVHMFHTLGAVKNTIARGAEERETAQRVAIERGQIAAMDTIVAATPLDRQQIIASYAADAERIRVVPCGVDLRHFQPRDMAAARAELGLPAAPHRLVLLVGRIEPLKGIDSLIRAIALLRDRRPEWRDQLGAVVVGGGAEGAPAQWNTEQRRLDALRTELGVRQAIHFAGARDQEQLPLFYAAADIVTMPSHYESFGMAALEGLACGRPVVATSAGGPAYIVEHGTSGLHAPPNDHVALAAQLERLLSDDSLRATMGQAARQRAQRFGWAAVANDILRVYDDTIERSTLARVATALPRAQALVPRG